MESCVELKKGRRLNILNHQLKDATIQQTSTYKCLHRCDDLVESLSCAIDLTYEKSST